jgi:cytochrome c biogenesis protein CcdA
MDEWIKQVFAAPEFGILVLPAGFLLGLITAFGSIGCCAPLFAAVIGFAGTRENKQRRDIFVVAGFFMLGSIIALSIAGGIVGLIGQAGNTLGTVGKIIIAIIAIFFGFASLNILPFHIPEFNPIKGKLPQGLFGASVFGLAFGGASIAYTMACCGPIMLPIALGLSMLKGQGVWGVLILTMFAIGFSLPLGAAMIGIGFGKLTSIANTIAKPVRIISGILLIGAGIWLLITL